MMLVFIEMIALLVVFHCIADYPLQSEFMAKAKNRTTPIQGVPFYQLLTAHAIIHGGFVWWATGHLYLGVAETVAHWFIDDAKCRGWFGYNTDQALHFICKFVWVAIFVMNGGE